MNKKNKLIMLLIIALLVSTIGNVYWMLETKEERYESMLTCNLMNSCAEVINTLIERDLIKHGETLPENMSIPYLPCSDKIDLLDIIGGEN